MDKKVYLLFCSKCGAPNRIPLYIVRDYIPNEGATKVYCTNCFQLNPLSGMIKRGILDLLTEKELKEDEKNERRF